MPARLSKTKKHRNKKTAKFGAKTKARRENHGTTASFPLTGPLPSLRYGVAVLAESIVVKTKKLAPAAAKAAR